jgi:hypothetical protein
MRPHLIALSTLAILSSCGGPVFGTNDTGSAADGSARDSGPERDTGIDASRDAAMLDAMLDASMDDGGRDGATSDTGLDSGTDAAVDGGRRGPAPVLLGLPTDLASAGAYALIGKTGITNVTGSMISGGHLGVSPSDSTTITGFSLILDPSNQFSTSVSVVPPARVYAADYAVPTPSNLTSAISSMESAYTDAATRPGPPDFLNLLSGHIGGQVLAPGLYTFGSAVDVTAGITLTGGPNDVWIFQITGDLSLAASTSMTLAGGAQASNVFWQVAGQVTLMPNSHFEGIVLCQTGITMQTRASFHGRALAQSLVALDDNMVVAP